MQYTLAASLPDRRRNPGNRTTKRKPTPAFWTGKTSFVFTSPDQGEGVCPWGTVLPSQLQSPRPITPEKELMLAILEDACEQYWRYRGGTTVRARHQRDELVRWFESRNGDWLYSFESICLVLGLPADRIRQGVIGKERRAA